MKDRIIEGSYRVLGEEPVRRKRRVNPAVRYVLTRPVFWLWIAMLSFVGLTEGLW